MGVHKGVADPRYETRTNKVPERKLLRRIYLDEFDIGVLVHDKGKEELVAVPKGTPDAVLESQIIESNISDAQRFAQSAARHRLPRTGPGD